jgi:putative hydrolase of the HAD superfamily
MAADPNHDVPTMQDSLKTDRALVFDFGRVVFRWRPEVLVAEALAHRASDAQAVRHWTNEIFQSYEGDWQHFDRGTVEPPELARRIAARTGLGEDEVHAVIDGALGELQPLADTVAWLRRLQAQGRPLHYLSNMPEPFARHFERTHDFMQAFESGVFSSRAKLVKPEPEIFAHAARVYGRAPQALLLLDDHLPNVVAARAAGWQAVQFHDAAQAEAEVAALGW